MLVRTYEVGVEGVDMPGEGAEWFLAESNIKQQKLSSDQQPYFQVREEIHDPPR